MGQLILRQHLKVVEEPVNTDRAPHVELEETDSVTWRPPAGPRLRLDVAVLREVGLPDRRRQRSSSGVLGLSLAPSIELPCFSLSEAEARHKATGPGRQTGRRYDSQRSPAGPPTHRPRS